MLRDRQSRAKRPSRQSPASAEAAPRDWLMAVFSLIAAGLLIAIARKAWLNADLSWDAVAYHLPFAGLRLGIIKSSEFRLSNWIHTFYETFPVLPDYLKGLLWKVTSRASAPNLLSLMALVGTIGALRYFFRIPAAISTIAFLATPIVLIQASSSYSDLFANCAMSLLLMMIFMALLWPERFGLPHLAVAVAAFGLALNSKFQFVIPAGAGVLALGAVIASGRRKFLLLAGFWQRLNRAWRTLAVAGVLLYLAICPLRYGQNWARFGNPFYPVAVDHGPIHFPGTIHELGVEPAYLATWPQPLRWIISLAEFRAFEGRNPLWTIDQGSLGPNSPGLRIGGYLSAWVGLNIAWFCYLQWSLRRRLGWTPAIFAGALSVFTSLLPASHELRYYMYWMLCLIAINLVLLGQRLAEPGARAQRSLYAGGALACLFFAANATGWAYLRVSYPPDQPVSAVLGIRRQLEQANLAPGERVCVLGKSPYTLFYAPYFNPELERKFHYSVQEGYAKADCAGLRILQ
ncbi:MAG: hypothetical protein IT160_04750 [Bryobacterales bacterium]|nr:hypothetical protein [Bryobacterales bacterium]